MRVSNRCKLRWMLATALALAACGDSLPGDPDPGSPDGSPGGASDASPGECEGRADGTPCGDASDGECDAADTCQGGACTANLVADGTPCGDQTDAECDAADTCAAGACSANLAADGEPCGDPADTDCDAADRCSEGLCLENVADDGTACYDCAGGPGQCETCSSAACDPATCVLDGQGTLSVPGSEANNNHGYMFDVQATSAVVVTSFDIHPLAAMTVRIYAKNGSHIGFESDADTWALVGSAAGVTPDGDQAVPVPIAVNWTIAAGATAAFYVTSTGGASVSYHLGATRATVAASDANLVLFEGTGKSYPFDTSFIPRVFEGNIHYTLLPVVEVLDSSTGTATGDDVDGVMFDLVADGAVEEADSLSVELDAGIFDVEVYFRRGTHVGFEGSSEGWQLLASQAGVVSVGGGTLSEIPLASPVDIAAGDTAAFYVDTGAGQAGLRTDPGAAVGDPAAVTADQTMLVGTALGGGFGAAGAASVFRGSLEYGACRAP